MAKKLAIFDPKALQEQLDFNHENLDTSMQRHAGYFAYYATNYAISERAVARADQLMDVVYAKADHAIRTAASEAGEKITEAKIKQQIGLDPRFVKAQSNFFDAKQTSAMWRAAADAFRQRKDIVQVAMNHREEWRGQTRVAEDMGSRKSDLSERAQKAAAS